jgi:hypothetical protein
LANVKIKEPSLTENTSTVEGSAETVQQMAKEKIEKLELAEELKKFIFIDIAGPTR